MLILFRSKVASLREYFTPINNNSNFSTTGEITPEEFVKAGDYLCYKFPTWEWGSAPDILKKDFLPPDKQYLVTRYVPSYQRALKYLGADTELDEDEEELDNGWIKSHKVPVKSSEVAIGEIGGGDDAEVDDLIDETAELNMDDFEDLSKTNDTTRKYDLYIGYSTSYRVPKLYLVGFTSNGIPLLPKQMFEDISSDYRDKTATIESLPFSLNTTAVLIHPCKHSSVMRVFMKHSQAQKKQLQDQDPDDIEHLAEEQGLRVDQYLIIFLKFIASVIPGIEYDYTMEAF